MAIGGAPASAISCQKITGSIRLAPRPPYSLGHEMPAQPPSYSVRCQPLEELEVRFHRLVAAVLPVLRRVRRKPRTQLVAELEFFGVEIQIHFVAGSILRGTAEPPDVCSDERTPWEGGTDDP